MGDISISAKIGRDDTSDGVASWDSKPGEIDRHTCFDRLDYERTRDLMLPQSNFKFYVFN